MTLYYFVVFANGRVLPKQDEHHLWCILCLRTSNAFEFFLSVLLYVILTVF